MTKLPRYLPRPKPAGVSPACTVLMYPYEYGLSGRDIPAAVYPLAGSGTPAAEYPLDPTRYRPGGVVSVSPSLDVSSVSSPPRPDGGGITTPDGSLLWYVPTVDGGSGTPAPV